jgi:2-desacetyl-2-hydroxyethyl bacteriochlorophyllide A dehydrogenase
MKAIKFMGSGKAEVQEVADPEPQPGEILLKVHSSALCGSENMVFLMEAEFPNIPGHEMSGEVVDPCGSDIFQKGDRVVVQIMNGCGECFYCSNGTPQFCESLQYMGGSHAQYVAMPEQCCIKMPDDISYDDAALLGGDTIGVPYRATQQLDLHPGTTVFISGAGPIGIGMIALLKFYGSNVAVSEFREYRREFALKNAGADVVLDPAGQDVPSEMKELTGGIGPDIIIECSGNPKAQIQALELVRCQGTVLFAGENYSGLNIIPSIHIIHKEIQLLGAFYFTASDFHEIVGLYRRGLKVDHLVSHRVPMNDAPEVFRLFAEGKTGKVIIHPWE